MPVQRACKQQELRIWPGILHQKRNAALANLPAPMAQLPRCLRLHPDTLRRVRGLPAQHPHAAHFLLRLLLLASLEETPEGFDPVKTLTLREMASWFPDRSGVVSRLPPTWTWHHAAAELETSPLQLRRPQLARLGSTPGKAATEPLSTPAHKRAPPGIARTLSAQARHGEPAGTSGAGLATLRSPRPRSLS